MFYIQIRSLVFARTVAGERQDRQEPLRSIKWHFAWPAVFIILGMQIGSGPAAAASRVEVITRDVLAEIKSEDRFDGVDGDHLFAMASQETRPNRGAGVGAGEAKATEGELSVYTFATAEATSALGYTHTRTDAQSTASWRDYITLTPKDGDYQPYWIEAQLSLTGSMVAHATGSNGHSAPWANSIIELTGSGIRGEGLDSWGQLAYFPANPQNNIDNPIGKVFSVRLLSLPGLPTFVTYELAATTIASAEVDWPGSFTASATGAASYQHTLAWEGITKVVDSAGNEIEGYTLSSRSGFNYVSAVPEPLPVVTLLLGLALIAVIRNPLRNVPGRNGFKLADKSLNVRGSNSSNVLGSIY